MNYTPSVSSDNFEGQKKLFIILLIVGSLIPLLVGLFVLSGEYCDNILKCSRVSNLCTHSIDRGIVDKLGLIKSIKKEFPVNSIKDTALDRYYISGSRGSRGRYMYHISLLLNGHEHVVTSGAGEGEDRANKLKASIDQFIHDKSLNDLSIQIEDKKTTEQTFSFLLWATFIMDLLLFPILYIARKTKQDSKQRPLSSASWDASSNHSSNQYSRDSGNQINQPSTSENVRTFIIATSIFLFILIGGFKLFPSDKLTRVSSTPSTNNNQTTYFAEQTKLIQKIPATGTDMSIEKAYASIPFSSTHFKRQSLNESTIKESHRQYLRSYLQLVNKALVQRIQTLAYFESQGHNGRNFEYYEGKIHTILSEFESLKVPPEFQKVQALTTLAINKQLNYFHELNNFKKNNLAIPHIPYGQNGQLHPLVVDSDKLLKMAYSELLVLYPQNESVFKDHLCALDFV